MGLRYAWAFFWTALFLLAERLWESFWPAFSLAALLAALAFSDVLFAFGNGAHIALLLIFAAMMTLAGIFAGKPFRGPARHEIDRAMEEAGRVPHNPLHALRDAPVEDSPLWGKHLSAAKEAAQKIRIRFPRPDDAARRDPFALRHAALLLCIIGFVAGGDEAVYRLKQSLQPKISFSAPARQAALEAWIALPEYTDLAPVFLGAAAETFTVPDGSVLKVRLSGSKNPPRLTYGDATPAFATPSPGNHTLEFPLRADGHLSIRKGWRKVGDWDVHVAPDTPPQTETLIVSRMPRAVLKVLYRAHDDHGLKSLTAAIEIEGETVYLDLPTDRGEMLTYTADLSVHPLSGERATITLTATDEKGQTARSAAQDFILPERTFASAAAQGLAQERKRLTLFNDPLTRLIAAMNLTDIASRPALYKGDPIVFLGLVMAVRRLQYDGDAESVASVRGLLWNLALRVEDGGLSLSAQELSDALQKLSEALKDKTLGEANIQPLLDDVQKKMRAYIQALASEMQQRLDQGKNIRMTSPELAEKFMRHIDMNKLLEKMRALTEGTGRERMQKLAEYLKNTVENLDPAQLDRMSQAQQQAMQALEGLQEIIRGQQSLLDRTNRMAKDRTDAGAQKEQTDLRDRLNDMIGKLAESMPEIPSGFSRAAQSMQKSGEDLAKNAPAASVPHQKKALEELQQALDQSIERMAQSMQQMILSFGFMPQGGSGAGFDPLGRPFGISDGSDVKIPDEKERRRVQEIIRELRHRSNDYQRPKVERDYIDRLLDTFN